MCDICNGTSFEQFLLDVIDDIRTTGWHVSGVEPELGRNGWAYTVGLMDSYDHPELVIVDDDWTRGAWILNALGKAVRDGAVFAPGERIHLGAAHAEIVDVHPVHRAGDLMGTWHTVHAPGSDTLPLDLEAHQLVVHGPLPDGATLPDVRLDQPGVVLEGYSPGPTPGPGRAA